MSKNLTEKFQQLNNNSKLESSLKDIIGSVNLSQLEYLQKELDTYFKSTYKS